MSHLYIPPSDCHCENSCLLLLHAHLPIATRDVHGRYNPADGVCSPSPLPQTSRCNREEKRCHLSLDMDIFPSSLVRGRGSSLPALTRLLSSLLPLETSDSDSGMEKVDFKRLVRGIKDVNNSRWQGTSSCVSHFFLGKYIKGIF